MSTEYQNSMENTHAPALDSGFEPNAGTQKVFVKRFDVNSVDMFREGHWAEMIAWCQENLYHGGHYEPNWTAQYPVFTSGTKKNTRCFC